MCKSQALSPQVDDALLYIDHFLFGLHPTSTPQVYVVHRYVELRGGELA